MRPMIFVLSTTLVLVAAAAAGDGTASGTMTVKATTTRMAYAYAMSTSNPFDKAKPALRLVLSDVALTPKVLADNSPFALQDLMRAGKLHAIEAIVSVDDKSVLGTQMYDPKFEMSSVSVAGTNIKLDVKTLDKTTFAGKLYTEKPDDFNKVPFEYAITFSAPITTK